MDTWSIGLDAWVVQDGNYGDFQSGQTAELAVEFFAPQPLDKTEDRTRSANRREGAFYEVTAQVTTVLDHAWVIDCGIGIYQDTQPPAGVEVGDWLQGVVRLGVDPFFYFERLHAIDSMPALIYTWRINTIARQGAPSSEDGRRRDRADADGAWTPVEKTDARHDHEGHASYVLDCVLLETPPKRQSATAL